MYDGQRTSGESQPYWHTQAAIEQTSDELPRGRVDVAIVGAGISGLSTAYHLLRAGRSVLVVDKGAIGNGETARSTAHVSNALDDHYHVLERVHGRAGARIAADSHTAAIQSIDSITARESISCEFARVDGYMFVPMGQRFDELELELDAAQRAGLAVDFVDRSPLPFETGPSLCFANQAQIDPLAYLHGLAQVVRRLGGVICTGRRVEHIDEQHPAVLHLQSGEKITAGAVVVATNSPFNDRFAMHTKQAPYRTYVIGVQIKPGSIPRALYWDTADPYHYLRLSGDDLLIVGGEDHKVGQSQTPEHGWARLEEWTRARFPGSLGVRYRWSGQVQEPADGMAYIGKNPGRADNVFIATGDSGNGITHGALAGILLTELIMGRENPWAELYSPSRKVTQLSAAREFVRENINVARRYGDWLLPGDKVSARIAPGQGAVVRRGVRRVAVYVDEAGARHECSATCTHLGCVVAWNGAERSWDCPCHGSRFDPYGHVLTGPAVRDLEPLTHEAPAPQPSQPSPSAEE